MPSSIVASEIEAANAAFLTREIIIWRSQLYGHRVCESYKAIQNFRNKGWREDYSARLCIYAGLLRVEMVSNAWLLILSRLHHLNSSSMSPRRPAALCFLGAVTAGCEGNSRLHYLRQEML